MICTGLRFFIGYRAPLFKHRNSTVGFLDYRNIYDIIIYIYILKIYSKGEPRYQTQRKDKREMLITLTVLVYTMHILNNRNKFICMCNYMCKYPPR